MARTTPVPTRIGGRAISIILLGLSAVCWHCERQSIDLMDEGEAGSSSISAGGSGAGGGGGFGSLGGGGSMGGSSSGGCPPGTTCPGGQPLPPPCPPNYDYCRRCDRPEDCDLRMPYCSPIYGHCVECGSHEDCPDPALQCDLLGTLRCMPACGPQGPSCPSERPFCDPARQVCLECVFDPDCWQSDRPKSRFCAGGECVECLRSADCTQPTPFCRDFTCSECRRDEDCPVGGRCDDRTGRCESGP
jgi:hypothetical protein